MDEEKEFIVEVMARYCKHLNKVIYSLQKQVVEYEKEKSKLEDIVVIKPAYKKQLMTTEKKIMEADYKLATVIPRCKKIVAFLEENKKYVSEENESLIKLCENTIKNINISL